MLSMALMEMHMATITRKYRRLTLSTLLSTALCSSLDSDSHQIDQVHTLEELSTQLQILEDTENQREETSTLLSVLRLVSNHMEPLAKVN